MAIAGDSFRRTVMVAVACVVACNPCLSDDDRLPEKQHGLRQIGYDARHVPRHFFKPRKHAKRKLLAVAGSTLLLYLYRDEIREYVQDHRSPGRSSFLNDVHTMGKGAFSPAMALVFYGSSFITDNPREKETAVLLLESAGYSAATAYTGSYVLAVERPEDGDSINFLDTNGRGVSLDAALAASVIPPLRRQYLTVRPQDGRARRFWKRTATTLLYGGALLTAYQRMDQDRHWAPDVFLGTAAGLNVGRTVCDAHDDARNRKARIGLNAGPRTVGLSFTIDASRISPRSQFK